MTGSMRVGFAHLGDAESNHAALAALAEGRVSPAERADAIEHLATCLECRTIVAELVRGHQVQPSTSIIHALPLAASVMIAVAGGGIYYYWYSHTAGPQISAGPTAPTVPDRTPAPPPTISAPPSSPPAPAPIVPAPRLPDGPRAAGVRTIGEKSFHLVAGEWIDDAYRVIDGLPVVDITSRDALDAQPALAPYRPLGRRFTVVVNATVYRIAIGR